MDSSCTPNRAGEMRSGQQVYKSREEDVGKYRFPTGDGEVLKTITLRFLSYCNAVKMDQWRYFASQSLYLLSVITCDERTTASAGAGVSFYSLTQAASPRLAPIVDITIAFKCFGVATSYLQVQPLQPTPFGTLWKAGGTASQPLL